MTDVAVLPDRIESAGLLLRAWSTDDLHAFDDAVRGSVEHLRPWMPWAACEPQTIAQRAELVERWTCEWAAGGDVALGIFVDGDVAGGCGLHRRRGPGVLEIGYWLRPTHVGRGLATATARALTDAAFAVAGIHAVELHHDKANVRSGAVPRRLGFTLIDEQPDEPAAPGEVGIDCTWRIERGAWIRRG
jgi:ribosomal-protein-serine acetyltransferase